jgi:Trk-type K+ transport system membrane component
MDLNSSQMFPVPLPLPPNMVPRCCVLLPDVCHSLSPLVTLADVILRPPFSAVEWSGFIVLDIGLAVTEALPTGQRVLAGLFQSLGVRASGFSIVSIGALAPACRFLYIIMMYISAYPIAMAVRGTNVYEERSLGVFSNREEQAQAAEPQEGEVFSKYLGWHVRQQLAFDIWWLAIALLLMDIIEVGGVDSIVITVGVSG